MTSMFNIEKLTSLLKDFYTLTQIRITVFDDTFTELTAYPPQIAPICQLVRTDPDAHANCKSCDKAACKIASRRRTAYTYRCHAGLTESIMPLYLDDLVIGYLFFGHVMTYPSHESAWDSIREHCSGYRIDKASLKQLCTEHPLISEDYITSASQILQAVATYVCLEQMVIRNQENLSVRLDSYVREHLTEDLSVPTLCRNLRIGKTQLYEISQKNYGTGIAAHIRTLRIEKAKKLLAEQPQLRVAEIAAQCGFPDYNYFITVFKRMVGVSPKQYLHSLPQ